MLNQFVLIGRLVDTPKLENEERAIIELATTKSFKNENGEYETDFINVVLYRAIATNTCEYCSKGDVVGIKGRIEADENKNIQLIAEKVTFLSSNSKNINEKINKK